MFGLAVAFTPLVGVQMPIVMALWAVIRFLRPQWEFNLVVALAWTWVTNVFTAPPVYYVFLVSGRALLGRWESITGLRSFESRLVHELPHDAGAVDTLFVYLSNIVGKFGLPMFVGSLPWMLLMGALGYFVSLRLVVGIRARRKVRRLAARATRRTALRHR